MIEWINSWIQFSIQNKWNYDQKYGKKLLIINKQTNKQIIY